MVIAGEEKGKTGKVLKVFPGERKVIIERVNLIKRHTKPGGKQQQGGIIEREEPINISNVMFFCTRCNQQARLGKKILADGANVRICRSCGEMVDKV